MIKNILIPIVILICFSAWSREKVVLTSFYPIHIATMNIVENIPEIKLISLTKPFSGCLHDYQLSPMDMVTISKADYFVVNGAGMESFLEKAIKNQKNLKVVEASQGITLLKNEGLQLGGNPHVWLSPTLAIQQVKNIANQLGKQMPEYKKDFDKNAAFYIQQLESLRDFMKGQTKNLKSRSFVTFHEAFPYFAKEFDLKITDVIEREPGTEPSARELSQIIKKLKQSEIKVIFAEPQYSAKSAQTIAKESGAQVYKLDPIVTGEYDKNAYLKIMRSNLDVLKKALGY